MQKDILKYAAINALLTGLYIVAIVSFLFYVPQRFFPEGPDTVIMPIMMLMLFVLSAGLTSSLVFGRPILWYLDGKKKEAVRLLFYTFGVFFLIILFVFATFLITHA